MSDLGDVNDRPPRLAQNAPLRAAIDNWQQYADQSVRNEVVGTVTLTETRDIIGQVTWTRQGDRKKVSVDATVLWQMAERKGPRVTITAKGEW
jgi:hypothetical protein